MFSYLIKQIIKKKPQTPEELANLKRRAAVKFSKKGFPKDSEILDYYRKNYSYRNSQLDKYFEQLLRAAPIRSLSGIVSVTVLTKPYPCPGHCIYCPQAANMPKSYLPNEPAAARASLLNFDPYKQVQRRLQSLQNQGHKTDKVELIILGATWSFYPKQYQTWFIKQCFKAANGDKSSIKKSLEKLQKSNEKATNRIVGLTIETRPDYITKREIKRLRYLGVTRLEIGVQSIYDDVLKFNRRGHGVAASIAATKLLKDAGLKINYHMMLDLPSSNVKKDKEMFKVLFSDSRFQPDWLKIYPTSVLKGAPLYHLWKQGKYKPYSTKKLLNLIIEIKKIIPPYVRITRLIRDIPSEDIIAGSEVSNLRQEAQREMEKRHLQCRCIRCREIRQLNYQEKIYLIRRNYDASEGKEIFLSFESKDRRRLYALLRLRIPSQVFSHQKHFIEELNDCALIRELHTYGDIVPLQQHSQKASQHKGLGKKLIQEAEKISQKEFKLNKITIISGIGVRGYYRKLGYRLKGTYMVKSVKK